MQKLTLKVEELAVESFATAAESDARGTVMAHATRLDTCDPAQPTCFGYTCYVSCRGVTCAESCPQTCDPRVGTCFGYTCVDACP